MRSWEQQKYKLLYYKRREPENTPLYRLISGAGSSLISTWGEGFQPTYGALRDEVRENLDAYLQCGILAHGCARLECSNKECNHSELLAFSCKKRAVCPSCDAKRAVLFAENLVENVLLPYDHRHLVFTVPKRIRPYFKYDRKNLRLLYTAAWESWKSFVQEKQPDASPAAVLALHSAGDFLQWHPHIHSIALAGAILPDGSFMQVDIDQQELTTRFAKHVLDALLNLELITQDVVDNMNSWEHSGFSAHIGELIPYSDISQLLFVARYLRKCPVSNERITLINPDSDCTVEFHSYKNDSHKSKTFTPLEFLAALSSHMPGRWEQLTRFLGAYSCRSRGAAKILKDICSTDAVPNIQLGLPEPIIKPSSSWARCMRKIFEVDPLQCRVCGSEMKIKSFITDPAQVHRITKHINSPKQRAPPHIKFTLPFAA